MNDNQAARAMRAPLPDQGRRLTTARRMVIEGLAQTREHVTAELLAGWIQHAHPEIHLSTVYRTLESLREWGLITQVRQPHGAAFFHLAPTHQHVVCEVCGHIEDVVVGVRRPRRPAARSPRLRAGRVSHRARGSCRNHHRSSNGVFVPQGTTAAD